MEIQIRKARSPLSSELYQWTPGNSCWYWLREESILTYGSNQQIQNFFNAMLVGLVVRAQAVYDRARKIMKVEL